MKEKELRRSMSIFPIGTVIQLTELTARQIRYYERQELIHPKRSDTNRRLYSLNDVDRLLEIKDYLNEGLNSMAIRRIYMEKENHVETTLNQDKKTLTDDDVRRILYSELLQQSQWRHGKR